MDEVPYVADFFHHVREESAIEMYNKIMKQPQPLIPLYEGLNLVKQGSLAYNTDGNYAYVILKCIPNQSYLSLLSLCMFLSNFSVTHR